jgi:hypothetical protein
MSVIKEIFNHVEECKQKDRRIYSLERTLKNLETPLIIARNKCNNKDVEDMLYNELVKLRSILDEKISI